MDMSEDKVMFAPDFLKMTREMEKKLADPNMNYQERVALMDKLTSLKIKWQEYGVRDPTVMKSIIKTYENTLAQFGMNSPAMVDSIESTGGVMADYKKKLAEARRILAEGEERGFVHAEY